MDAGELVPDALLLELLEDALPATGFLLDGFPRTLSQAEALGLGPLSGSGGPEQDQAGYFRNPSYERIISWASIWRIVSRATPTTIRIEVPPRTPKNTFESGR